jgi:hypothetical protein
MSSGSDAPPDTATRSADRSRPAMSSCARACSMACGQLAVRDGDQALGRPGCGAGGEQPGCLPAQAGNRAGVTWRCGSGAASGGYRLAHHPDRVAQVAEQRFQIQAAPRNGARQELRGGHPRTGERINDRGFKQLRPQLSGTTVTTPVLPWRRPGRGGDVFPRHAERPRTGRVEEADDPRDPSRAHWPTVHRGSVVRRICGRSRRGSLSENAERTEEVDLRGTSANWSAKYQAPDSASLGAHWWLSV